ncbi:class I SAM-dependent methyltransferase [Fibrella arboris]|uniref:class I SAM-dependent methyltransferase n=1 Tax=Fibrella arboris TaxID=3242486 RepID=UPI00351FEFB1
MKPHLSLALLIGLTACNRPQSATQNQSTTKTDSAPASSQKVAFYTEKTPAYDGTGRVYLGREISQVMGHLGAEWLERPERQQEERTDLLLAALDLKPTDVVADIGAGTGYFSFRLARAVPQGNVLAVDIQPEMIEYLNEGKKKENLTNVEPILGTITDPKLPANSVDLALMVDAYHEFSNPREMGVALARSLKPGGRIVLVEYRAEDPNVPIKEHHKMSVMQATREMTALGLKLLKNDSRLPQQHVLIFGKK